jgi:hypothetical protein
MTVKGYTGPIPAKEAVTNDTFTPIAANHIVGLEPRGVIGAVHLHIEPRSFVILTETNDLVLELHLYAAVRLRHAMAIDDLDQGVQGKDRHPVGMVFDDRQVNAGELLMCTRLSPADRREAFNAGFSNVIDQAGLAKDPRSWDAILSCSESFVQSIPRFEHCDVDTFLTKKESSQKPCRTRTSDEDLPKVSDVSMYCYTSIPSRRQVSSRLTNS